MKWEPAIVKNQIRLASQKLGQVQAKNDSQANITRTDIATLVQRGNVPLARDKAEKLIQDEAFGDLLEELEMQIGVLLEHFQELEHGVIPSPIMVEAVSSVIHAAPFVNSKDLDAVRDYLVYRLGRDFARSAVANRDHHVSPRILKALYFPVPSAYQLDSYLQTVVESYGVKWLPEPQRYEIVNSLSECLDPEASPIVDLPRLRKLCSRGIPEEPSWLRPRIWKLFLGTLPLEKTSWDGEKSKKREAYYDLLRQVLEPVSRLSQMTESTHLDDTLLKVHKQLTGLPANLYDLLEDEPDNSSLYPQNDAGVQVSFAEALDLRLKALKSQTHNGPRTPEIRLEPDVGATPDISLTGLESMTSERSATSTTLLMSKAIIFGNAHPKHCSSLLRLLYLHTVINPGNLSPHTPSLLVPLYSTLMQEVEPEELAHVEADTFWLLEALLAELSGLEDDGGYFWMKRFSERLAWANPDVFAELQAKGLDPALPHYSYRWLMTLLTHTLPLSALFPVWDVLFSCHGRERDSNPKLDFLIDFCSSMLIRAKPALFRLGKSGHNAPSLWTGETDGLSESISSVNEDAFLKEIYFLQHYSLKHVGGIERILQTAFDMTQRRTQETANALQSNLSLGARIKVNIWKGFTQQPSSNDTPPEGRSTANDYSDSDDTETSSGPSQTSIASRVSNTVWRGITNQTAMDSPPTPPSPESPIPRRLESIDVAENEGTPSVSDNTTATSNIWSYAEKLKDSNTVATLSKVGSNWRARAFMGTWGGSTSRTPGGDTLPQTSGDDNAPPSLTSIGQNSNGKWYSFSGYDSIGTRPTSAHQPLLAAPLQSPSENPLQSNGNTVQKSKSFLPTVRSPQATPKSAPRPLLLGSSSPILSGQLDGKGQPRSTGSLTTPDTEEWADVMMAKRQHFHRDSQSSISSLSPSDAFGRTPKSTRSGWDSDVSSSRIVSLNRRSVSPMAPNFRVNQGRSSSRNSSTSSEILSPPTRVRSPLQNSRAIDRQSNTPSINDINTTSSISHSILSPPNPQAVVPSCNAKDSDGSETTSNELSSSARKPTWKRAELEETGSVIPTRAARVRSKRYPRPANLQIQDNQKPRISAEQKAPSPSNLTVEWPREDIETAMTPKASNFESDDLTSVSPRMPKSPRSPHRSRKVSTGEIDRQRKGSTDTIHDSRPRKVSSGNRSRKISTESREIPTSQRESAAEEGDDEGYDELLSAYESEDGHNGSVMF